MIIISSLFIASLFGAVLNYFIKYKDSPTSSTPKKAANIFILITTVTCISITFWISLNSYKEKLLAIAQKNETDHKYDSIHSLITVLEKETLNQITGNGNKPLMKGSWVTVKDEPYWYAISLVNPSKYPLHSIVVLVSAFYVERNSFQKKYFKNSPEDLGPGGEMTVFSNILPLNSAANHHIHFIIEVRWSQGTYHAFMTVDGIGRPQIKWSFYSDKGETLPSKDYLSN